MTADASCVWLRQSKMSCGRRVVGAVVNAALIYLSALYGVVIASCMVVLRGGAFDAAFDLPLWSTLLALPASIAMGWWARGTFCTTTVVVCWLLLPFVALYACRMRFVARRKARAATATATASGGDGGSGLSIGLFHPHCEQGGGERVLWSLVHHLAVNTPSLRGAHFYVYTQPAVRVSADRESEHTASGVEILQRVRQTFGINLLTPEARDRLHFVWLNHTGWLDSARYPRMTLLLQALGSVIPAFEALWRYTPHVFVDTCGYPFIYPVLRLLGGCRTACYTHYPTISSNMLQRVTTAAATPAATAVATVKVWYYRAFAQFYALMGRCVDTVMVNSQWTHNQLTAVWGPLDGRLHCVYPPCMVADVSALALTPRQPFLLSVAQFRPEKRHDLLLRVFAKVLAAYTRTGGAFADALKVVFVGTLRDRDRPKVDALRALATELGISERVIFEFDVDNATLRSHFLGRALVGLHAMTDEHFGIGVVELMASGVITIAHRSGGPLADIVVPAATAPDVSPLASDANAHATGYLCAAEDEYAAIQSVLFTYEHQPNALQRIQTNARAHVQRFSDDTFRQSLDRVLIPRLTL